MAFPSQVDRLAQRAGLPPELVAILLVVAGVLVILFPRLISWFVGLVFIVLGVWWLVSLYQQRQRPLAPPPGP